MSLDQPAKPKKAYRNHKSQTEALSYLLREVLRLKRGHLSYSHLFGNMSEAGFRDRQIDAAIGRMIDAGEAYYFSEISVNEFGGVGSTLRVGLTNAKKS